jgi:hypothetical protein
MNRKSSVGDFFISKQVEKVETLVQLGLVKQAELAADIAEIKRILVLQANRVSPELEAAIKQVSLTARQIDRKVKD